jgi:hypothetical protein
VSSSWAIFWKSGKTDSRVLLWNLVANNSGQSLGIFAAIILIAVIVALKMYEMSQGKKL